MFQPRARVDGPSSAETARLIAPPPKINQANSDCRQRQRLDSRRADRGHMGRDSERRHGHRQNDGVQADRGADHALRQQLKELNAATPTKPSANHGMTMRPGCRARARFTCIVCIGGARQISREDGKKWSEHHHPHHLGDDCGIGGALTDRLVRRRPPGRPRGSWSPRRCRRRRATCASR